MHSIVGKETILTKRKSISNLEEIQIVDTSRIQIITFLSKTG
jgi:hypothetical protein